MLFNLFTIFLGSLIVSFLLQKIKIPNFCSFLLVGFISKKFNILNEFNLEILSKIGILLLLFSVGIEMSFKGIQSIKKYIIPSFLSIAIVSILITIPLMFFFPLKLSIILGLASSLSSTAIMIFFLNDTNKMNTNTGHFSLSLLIMQDILSILILLLIQPFNISKFFFGLITFLLLFFLFNFFINKLLYKSYKSGKEIFILFISVIILGFCNLGHVANLSEEMGAMCAGIIFSDSKFTIKIEAYTETIKQIFLMFFFINIGCNINTMIFINNYKIILLGSLLLIIIKIVGVLLGSFQLVSKKNSIITSLISCNISETSFLIIQKLFFSNILNSETTEIIILIFLSSIFLSPFFILLAKYYNKKNIEKSNNYSRNFDVLIVGYNLYTEKIIEKLKKMNVSCVIIDDSLDNIIKIKSMGYKAYLGNFFINHHFPIDKVSVIILTNVESHKPEQILEIKNIYYDSEIIVLTRDKRMNNILINNDVNSIIIPSKEFIHFIVDKATSYLINDKLKTDNDSLLLEY